MGNPTGEIKNKDREKLLIKIRNLVKEFGFAMGFDLEEEDLAEFTEHIVNNIEMDMSHLKGGSNQDL